VLQHEKNKMKKGRDGHRDRETSSESKLNIIQSK
jgi:hypothetical protein